MGGKQWRPRSDVVCLLGNRNSSSVIKTPVLHMMPHSVDYAFYLQKIDY